jgi:nucleotide-binding universal stress UspA family protein
VTTVLISLDGSEKDQRAMPAGAAFAELLDADLHLIRVLGPPPLENLPPRAHTMGVAEALAEIHRDALRSVRAMADQLSADTGRPVTMEVSDGHDVAFEILTGVSKRNAAVIVMATRAAGALGRTLRGSVADQIMRESPHPVVLVPPRAADEGATKLLLRRVLIPLDGSSLATTALDMVLELERAHRLAYVLLEVVTSGFIPLLAVPTAPAWPADMPIADAYERSPDLVQTRRAAEQRLRVAADHLRSSGAASVEIRDLVAEEPAGAIVGAAHDERVDFIAMTTRGSGGLKRLLLGSVAERVVRTSTVPVLLLTPRSLGEA